MEKVFCHPEVHHPYIIFWQIKTPDFIFQLLSIISHPFGFILQQTPIQNYIETPHPEKPTPSGFRAQKYKIRMGILRDGKKLFTVVFS